MIQTNEYNNETQSNLKNQVSSLRERKELLDQKKIHYNTQQLNENKAMIETNAELKQIAKNPGGKQRNPKLDQQSRFFKTSSKKFIDEQEMSPIVKSKEDINQNDLLYKVSKEKTNLKIKEKMKTDAFVEENLNNKRFTEN